MGTPRPGMRPGRGLPTHTAKCASGHRCVMCTGVYVGRPCTQQGVILGSSCGAICAISCPVFLRSLSYYAQGGQRVVEVEQGRG